MAKQAYLDKHKQRQSHQFAPHELRELAPTERTGSDSVSYVKLEGLGKIPFSNIRRPKPLMDVDPTPAPAKPDQGQLRPPPSTSNCAAVLCL